MTNGRAFLDLWGNASPTAVDQPYDLGQIISPWNCLSVSEIRGYIEKKQFWITLTKFLIPCEICPRDLIIIFLSFPNTIFHSDQKALVSPLWVPTVGSREHSWESQFEELWDTSCILNEASFTQIENQSSQWKPEPSVAMGKVKTKILDVINT